MRRFVAFLTLLLGFAAGYVVARQASAPDISPANTIATVTIVSADIRGEPALFDLLLSDRLGEEILRLERQSTPFDTTIDSPDFEGTITPVDGSGLDIEVSVGRSGEEHAYVRAVSFRPRRLQVSDYQVSIRPWERG